MTRLMFDPHLCRVSGRSGLGLPVPGSSLVGLTPYLVLLALCPLLMAATPVVLMDQQLEPHPVFLHALRGDEIQHYAQGNRALVSESLSKYLRITIRQTGIPAPAAEEADAFAQAWVMLTDGQRLSGGFLAGSNDGQRILWRHGLIGEVEIPIERIRMIDLGSRPLGPLDRAPAGADAVLLANGDLLSGFVEALIGETIRLQLDDDAGTTITLTMDRVAAVRLGNPATQSGTSGHLVTLADGSNLLAASLSISGDEVSFDAGLTTAGRAMRLALEHVRRVDLSAAGRRLVPLGALPMSVEGAARTFTVAMPPYVRAERIHLHAPVTVRFTLPDGAVRWAGRIALEDLERQGPAGAWADCELVIRGDGRVLGRYRLNPTQSAIRVNTPLEALDLVIELREGANGPVMDRVVIEEAAVLIDLPR